MADKDGPDSPERLAGAAETLSWLAGQVQTSGISAIFSHAHMIGALSLARSYVQEFAAFPPAGQSFRACSRWCAGVGHSDTTHSHFDALEDSTAPTSTRNFPSPATNCSRIWYQLRSNHDGGCYTPPWLLRRAYRNLKEVRIGLSVYPPSPR